MYFIPRNNWLYSFLITRHRWQWGCMTLVLSAAIIAAWWLFCLVPLQDRVARVQQEHSLLLGQQSALAHLTQEVHALESHIAVLQGEFRSLVGSSGAEYKRLLNAVLVYVVESGLALDNCSLKVPETQKLGDKPWCVTHPVELSVSGTFAQLLTFFQRLGAQQSPIFLHNFSVQQAGAGKLVATVHCELLEIVHA